MLFKLSTYAYSLISGVNVEEIREVVNIDPQKRANYLNSIGPTISTKNSLLKKIVLFDFFSKKQAKKRVKAILKEVKDKHVNPWETHAEFFRSCEVIPLPRDGEIDYLIREIEEVIGKAKRENELNAHQAIRLSHLSYLLMKETI